MPVKLYDVLGNEKDAAWLASTWGATVDTSLRRAGSGNFNFVLVELREMEGPSAYNVRVVDREGAPFSGRFVGRYYPGAPNSWPGATKPNDIPAPAEAKTHVVFGTTGVDGQVQFGVGNGDYAGPGDGVTMFWLAEHYAGTDVVKKLGMLPNTNHRMLSPKFQYLPFEVPVPPVSPGTGEEPEQPGTPAGDVNWIPIAVRVLRAVANALENK